MWVAMGAQQGDPAPFGSLSLRLPLQTAPLLVTLANLHQRWATNLPQPAFTVDLLSLQWSMDSVTKATVVDRTFLTSLTGCRCQRRDRHGDHGPDAPADPGDPEDPDIDDVLVAEAAAQDIVGYDEELDQSISVLPTVMAEAGEDEGGIPAADAVVALDREDQAGNEDEVTLATLPCLPTELRMPAAAMSQWAGNVAALVLSISQVADNPAGLSPQCISLVHEVSRQRLAWIFWDKVDLSDLKGRYVHIEGKFMRCTPKRMLPPATVRNFSEALGLGLPGWFRLRYEANETRGLVCETFPCKTKR